MQVIAMLFWFDRYNLIVEIYSNPTRHADDHTFTLIGIGFQALFKVFYDVFCNGFNTFFTTNESFDSCPLRSLFLCLIQVLFGELVIKVFNQLFTFLTDGNLGEACLSNFLMFGFVVYCKIPS